jgi:hypothetical protein
VPSWWVKPKVEAILEKVSGAVFGRCPPPPPPPPEEALDTERDLREDGEGEPALSSSLKSPEFDKDGLLGGEGERFDFLSLEGVSRSLKKLLMSSLI